MKSPGAALCAFVAILACVTGVTPSRAAPAVEWEDPAGDATALPGMESSPRPSDSELDILKARFATRGHDIVASAQVADMSLALGSGGSTYRFYFSFDDQRYYFEAAMAESTYFTVFGASPGFYREGSGDAADEELYCFCRNSFVFGPGGSVTFTVYSNDVATALGIDENTRVDLTGLEIRSLRTVYEKIEADTARAPRGTTLRV